MQTKNTLVQKLEENSVAFYASSSLLLLQDELSPSTAVKAVSDALSSRPFVSYACSGNDGPEQRWSVTKQFYLNSIFSNERLTWVFFIFDTSAFTSSKILLE